VIVVTVTAASVSDAAGANGLLRQVSRFDQPRLETLFVDQAYHREELYAFAAQHLSYTLQVGNRPPGAVGFVPIRKRWVVERTFGLGGSPTIVATREIMSIYLSCDDIAPQTGKINDS